MWSSLNILFFGFLCSYLIIFWNGLISRKYCSEKTSKGHSQRKVKYIFQGFHELLDYEGPCSW